MTVTTNDGCRLNVIAGEPGGVPLVFSNSLGTDHTLWDAQRSGVGRAAIWRYDTRGHGQSEARTGDYTIDRLGQDLLSVIDATGAEKVDVCGLSIGGVTAQWLAVHHPARIRRLVLANTAARIGTVEMWNERIKLVHASGTAALADATMQRWFTERFRAAQPAVVAGIRATLVQTSAVGYAGCCAALRDADLRALAGSVTCPTLVIAGAHDPATPPQDGEWLAEHIRGAELVMLDAAHLSNVERATDFNAAVRSFCSTD